ncbi:hypothetical protein [Bacillus sp. NPDC077027]|uniref:hypothetical protein n=1 Tax=Bacillus sp. NPDC077027 TaxID=3390548 RepID=UPI003D07D41D
MFESTEQMPFLHPYWQSQAIDPSLCFQNSKGLKDILACTAFTYLGGLQLIVERENDEAARSVARYLFA